MRLISGSKDEKPDLKRLHQYFEVLPGACVTASAVVRLAPILL